MSICFFFLPQPTHFSLRELVVKVQQQESSQSDDTVTGIFHKKNWHIIELNKIHWTLNVKDVIIMNNKLVCAMFSIFSEYRRGIFFIQLRYTWNRSDQGWVTFFLSRAISNFITSFQGHTELFNTYITLASNVMPGAALARHLRLVGNEDVTSTGLSEFGSVTLDHIWLFAKVSLERHCSGFGPTLKYLANVLCHFASFSCPDTSCKMPEEDLHSHQFIQTK